jgi:polyhydroxyalkanoate synthesis regulator phasin
MTSKDENEEFVDPIVEQIRAERDRHAAAHDYDIEKIFQSVKEMQQTSNRTYVSLPPRLIKSEEESHSTEK